MSVRKPELVATPNNGYFDSPVMSRDHAELTADFESGVRKLPFLVQLHVKNC
jgi:hypothetical protein